jgi:hypothetical protein
MFANVLSIQLFGRFDHGPTDYAYTERPQDHVASVSRKFVVSAANQVVASVFFVEEVESRYGW